MTREEAVMTINFLKEDYKQLLTEEDAEALDMAIEALQKPPISQRSMYQAGYRQAQEDRSSGDLISRAEAIEAVHDACNYCDTCDLKDVGCSQIRSLKTLPSADRPKGEWIEQEDDYYHYWECSECGMGVGLDDIRNFCPNCGADMRGEDE